MHLLKRYLVANGKVKEEEMDEQPHQDETDEQRHQDETEYKSEEISTAMASLEKPKEVSSFNQTKQKTKGMALSLMQRVENCSNLDCEALVYLQKQMMTSLNTFDAMCKHKFVTVIKPTINIPSNKNIVPQNNFYSTKKKRKQNSNIRFAKPTTTEKDNFFIDIPSWLIPDDIGNNIEITDTDNVVDADTIDADTIHTDTFTDKNKDPVPMNKGKCNVLCSLSTA